MTAHDRRKVLYLAAVLADSKSKSLCQRTVDASFAVVVDLGGIAQFNVIEITSIGIRSDVHDY